MKLESKRQPIMVVGEGGRKTGKVRGEMERMANVLFLTASERYRKNEKEGEAQPKDKSKRREGK